MIIFVDQTTREHTLTGQFSINCEWVGQLSDSTTREFNELSDIVQSIIRPLLSDDVKYIKRTEFNFR